MSTARRDKTDEWDARKPVTEPKHKHGCLYSQAFGTACSCGEVESAAAQPEPHICETSDDITGNWRCSICGKYGNREAVPSAAAQPAAFNWDLSQGEWYLVGDDPYWKTIMSRKTRSLIASSVQTEHAERIVNMINGKAVPPAAETAMTAEQFWLNDSRTKGKAYADLDGAEEWLEFAEAYAAHVREAAQGEIAGLQRGFVNIYHFVTDKDCDPKIGIGMSTSAVCQLKEKLETAERKLAELEKALQGESHTEALLKGRLEEFLRMKNERPIDPTYWDTHEENGIRAALASLRAESQEKHAENRND